VLANKAFRFILINLASNYNNLYNRIWFILPKIIIINLILVGRFLPNNFIFYNNYNKVNFFRYL